MRFNFLRMFVCLIGHCFKDELQQGRVCLYPEVIQFKDKDEDDATYKLHVEEGMIGRRGQREK